MAHDAEHAPVLPDMPDHARAAGAAGAAVASEAAPARRDDDESTRRWLILGVVCLGQLMVVLDATVVNIALPTAQHDLAFSNADRQWAVTAYSLAFGGLLLLGGVLTEYLSWRWCLYSNVIFAVVAAAARPLRRDWLDTGVKLDVPGAVLVIAGLISLVYGLSRAETDSWGAPLTIVLLAVGAAILVLFVLVEQRVARPLLPLRIVLDRFRGGTYLAIGLSAVGMFGSSCSSSPISPPRW